MACSSVNKAVIIDCPEKKKGGEIGLEQMLMEAQIIQTISRKSGCRLNDLVVERGSKASVWRLGTKSLR